MTVSATQAFVGYNGTVWSKVVASLSYLMTFLGTATSLADTAAASEAVFNTIVNGVVAIDANTLLETWSSELANLQTIQALPLTLDPTSATVLANRSAALAAAVAALPAYVPSAMSFPVVATALSQSMPVIPDPNILQFYQQFNYETPPAGLSTANLLTSAAGIATAFVNIANAISILQGANLTQSYDVATRFSITAGAAAYTIGQMTSSAFSAPISLQYLWNQMATLPALITDANIVSSAPYSLAVQQSCVMRYAMLQMAFQLALFLLVLSNPQATIINLATVQNGDSLMDVAARSLNDFEQWYAIAKTNGLVPPWTAATAASGVAAYGSQVILPSAGASPSLATSTPPNYLNNFLGIDLFLGPLNQPMLPWAGDFQLISGYQNLAISLGRRLQTTLGSLIYHSDFGSRIPPEVGAIQSQTSAGRIAAFGKSAILSDPRVAAVLNASGTLQANGLVAFNGTVQPAGFGSTAVDLNEVISPI